MEQSSQKVTVGGGDRDLAQAFKDLARGEQTASAMENKLSGLEQRIDDLLASMEENSRDKNSVDTEDEQRRKE
ncbi:hypothetical protein MMC11_002892 [Xylographa trunciseda]|nr:hypothetical protein [Xylographa trunciseda]